jgi:hypothetical protein
MHRYVKDLTGQTFGRLHVLCAAARPENSKGRGQHWACICSCTNEIVVRSDSLLQGKSTSCGCTNESTTRMRATIGPRRPKSTVSVQPSKDCTQSIPIIILDMTEKKSTYSDTVAVKREELEAMRNTLTNVSAANLLSATHSVKYALDRMIDAEKCRAQRTASYASENDQPRTVTGETMSEYTKHIRNALIKLTPEKACDIDRILLKPTEEKMRLQFKPELNNLSERKHSHYFKKCPYDAVDVYRVLELFGVTDQALGHAIKKLMVAGGRGAGKDIGTDIQEAIDTLLRWQEMRREDVAGSLAILDLMKA